MSYFQIGFAAFASALSLTTFGATPHFFSKKIASSLPERPSLAAVGDEFPSVSQLPKRDKLVDPLVMLGGTTVTNKSQWLYERRPELIRLLRHYMYGELPETPAIMTFSTNGVYSDFLEGKATMKLVTIGFRDLTSQRIDLMLVTPNEVKQPPPVILGINFSGNYSITPDPRVPLARGFLSFGSEGEFAKESARGGEAKEWPIADVISRGYALATFSNCDIDADVRDGPNAQSLPRAAETAVPTPEDRGTLMNWAWGVHRCVDFLMQEPAVDHSQIALFGHSRNAIVALLAAALDTRIALTIVHEAPSIGPGANLGTRESALTSEQTAFSSIAIQSKKFPQWFNRRFKEFASCPENLPFDTDCLIALVSPRPILVTAGYDDATVTPATVLTMVRAAAPVYTLFGYNGFNVWPNGEPGRLVHAAIGVYFRRGGHEVTPQDWKAFMDFSDAHFKKRKPVIQN